MRKTIQNSRGCFWYMRIGARIAAAKRPGLRSHAKRGNEVIGRIIPLVIMTLCLLVASGKEIPAQEAAYLGDEAGGVTIKHEQQWGDFGLNTAAAVPGTKGSPLQIGQKTFAKGLGHHANGEIIVDLRGRYSSFAALAGVHWQGGGRGRMIFRVSVDGKIVFDSGPMTDSDPPKEINVPIEGARELRLIADDGGDGIGCDMANWIEARLVRKPGVPYFGEISASFMGEEAPAASAAVCGLSMIAGASGPQVAIAEPIKRLTVSVDRDEDARLVIPVNQFSDSIEVTAGVTVIGKGPAEVELSLGDKRVVKRVESGQSVDLTAGPAAVEKKAAIVLTTRGIDGETGVRWSRFRYSRKGETFDVPLLLAQPKEQIPPPTLPNPRPSIERELIEWDWRMQDGIGTQREPCSWADATQKVLDRGDKLIEDLAASGVALKALAEEWTRARADFNKLAADENAGESAWEELWLRVHHLRRKIVFENPLADTGPLVFAKNVPSIMSHQLTQYSGICSRPGGGIFVLDAPGKIARLPPTRPIAHRQLPTPRSILRRQPRALCLLRVGRRARRLADFRAILPPL